MELAARHLTMLLQYQRWAPPSNQLNMPAPHPVTLTELFEHGLLDRNAAHEVVLTAAGEAAVQAAVCGMRSAARQVVA